VDYSAKLMMNGRPEPQSATKQQQNNNNPHHYFHMNQNQ